MEAEEAEVGVLCLKVVTWPIDIWTHVSVQLGCYLPQHENLARMSTGAHFQVMIIFTKQLT